MKGVRIEKSPLYWHVCIKHSYNRQGYVEIGRFILFTEAIKFATERVMEELK